MYLELVSQAEKLDPGKCLHCYSEDQIKCSVFCPRQLRSASVGESRSTTAVSGTTCTIDLILFISFVNIS